MFGEAIIHYPPEEKTAGRINRELMNFHCDAAVRYIEDLELTESQMDALYRALANEAAMCHREQHSK